MTATGASDEGVGARGAPVNGPVDGPWWWARRRSAVLDVFLAAASALECLIEGAKFADEAQLPELLGLLLGLLAGSVLLVRRRWPVAVVLVSIAVMPAEMGVLLGLVGLYTLAASDLPRRITALLAGMSVVGSWVTSYLNVQQGMAGQQGFRPPLWFAPVTSVAVGLLLTAPPVLWGLYIGARRRLVESLRERADGLERELSLLADRAEERAEWARNEERTRIAREMHDVVAHRVSLMVVHAAALQAVALKDPEKASRNAGLVGDMGRQALTELREMLGVLRTAEGPAVRGGSAPAASERLAAVASRAGAQATERDRSAGPSAKPSGGAPTAGPGAAGAASTGAHVPEQRGGEAAAEGPHLAELADLVGQSRAAGMTVELTVDEDGGGTGDAGDAEGAAAAEAGCRYAARVERTVYRVVQEALTNVHKHAPGAQARVRLAHRDGELAVQVENGPGESGAAGAGLPSGGNGLVGMRERVTALGGVFVSGPTETGGFRVSAVLPVSPVPAA
ncbi:sensor histidine kinase [Streptomyces kronopolitis]|uniref:sensor histidine kinase n=1 Tax=Streptomyces kronopolitis TaxID=1612435 RepID=UPI0020BF7443|nr:histidine kinase [Streptomyces kronopolitis]MCL6296995.1 histidine kinase [Streptomyces kronopolitis]